jgi:hypothetical protein
MYDLLFSTPWWLPTLFCGLGIGLFVIANNRQETRLRNVSVGIFLFGIAIALVSYLVETPKEKVERHTRELIASVVSQDWPKIQSLLDPQIVFAGLHGPAEVTHAMQLAQQDVHVTSAHITSMKLDVSPGDISNSINVLTFQQATLDRPIVSGWRLDWAPTPNNKDWKLIRVECLGAGQITAAQIESHIPGTR